MARLINPAALAILKGAEQCRLNAYPDPGSGGAPWTIGWGHAVGVAKGMVWTQAQADAAFQQDVAQRADQVEHAIGAAFTSDNQFGAMVSLAYNIGIEHFLESSVLRFHLQGEHHEAADAFLAWDKSCGRVLEGLVIRRKAEAKLYLTGSTAA